MTKTIVFTGGHHNSALLVAQALKAKGYRILWLGHQHASVKDKNISQEYRDVMAADITFINLKSGKIHNGNFWKALKTLISLFFCIPLFLKERPALIVSFGGYLAFSPVLAAWLLRIPSISHEQTTVLGMANKAILPLVKIMYLTWPIKEYLNHKKIKVIGLPSAKYTPQITNYIDLNSELAKLSHPMKLTDFNKPLMVISGGKQGSHAINELVERCLQDLFKKWNILHQCGSNLATKDYQKILRKRQRMPYEMQSSYVVIDYMLNFKDVLSISNMVIGRSGAHTTMEVLSLAKKMLAIPLPFSYED